MNSPRKHTSKLREQLASQGDSVRRARLPKKMRIAMKISNALDSLNWKDNELAIRLDKYSSEVSKWLKGDHNFTIDTLSDIEEILGIHLLDFDNPKTISNASTSEVVKLSAVNSTPLAVKEQKQPVTGKLVTFDSGVYQNQVIVNGE